MTVAAGASTTTADPAASPQFPEQSAEQSQGSATAQPSNNDTGYNNGSPGAGGSGYGFAGGAQQGGMGFGGVGGGQQLQQQGYGGVGGGGYGYPQFPGMNMVRFLVVLFFLGGSWG